MSSRKLSRGRRKMKGGVRLTGETIAEMDRRVGHKVTATPEQLERQRAFNSGAGQKTRSSAEGQRRRQIIARLKGVEDAGAVFSSIVGKVDHLTSIEAEEEVKEKHTAAADVPRNTYWENDLKVILTIVELSGGIIWPPNDGRWLLLHILFENYMSDKTPANTVDQSIDPSILDPLTMTKGEITKELEDRDQMPSTIFNRENKLRDLLIDILKTEKDILDKAMEETGEKTYKDKLAAHEAAMIKSRNRMAARAHRPPLNKEAEEVVDLTHEGVIKNDKVKRMKTYLSRYGHWPSERPVREGDAGGLKKIYEYMVRRRKRGVGENQSADLINEVRSQAEFIRRIPNKINFSILLNESRPQLGAWQMYKTHAMGDNKKADAAMVLEIKKTWDALPVTEKTNWAASAIKEDNARYDAMQLWYMLVKAAAKMNTVPEQPGTGNTEKFKAAQRNLYKLLTTDNGLDFETEWDQPSRFAGQGRKSLPLPQLEVMMFIAAIMEEEDRDICDEKILGDVGHLKNEHQEKLVEMRRNHIKAIRKIGAKAKEENTETMAEMQDLINSSLASRKQDSYEMNALEEEVIACIEKRTSALESIKEMLAESEATKNLTVSLLAAARGAFGTKPRALPEYNPSSPLSHTTQARKHEHAQLLRAAEQIRVEQERGAAARQEGRDAISLFLTEKKAEKKAGDNLKRDKELDDVQEL